MAINYKKCPKCNSTNTGVIRYGEPNYMFPVDENIRFGGCSFSLDSPSYFCHECNHEWNRDEAINEAYSKIGTIIASVGGYFEGYYTVILDLDNKHVKWSFSLACEEVTTEKSIRTKTVTNFIEDLKSVHFLDWKAKYLDMDICDGTQWSVEIITSEKTIKKYGSNQFPKGWGLFCRGIRRISGKPFK
ncbi:hypothetical protein [Anaerosolibacter sp.]|uniref:hypothetical protein n=1 Tax=Anaerosolibacter sp. TaxID=1872527 RepID=UPI0039EE415D